MDKPTNYEPSASATRPQDQAIHSADRQIVETPLELHNRGLGLNSKRLDLIIRQALLNAELLELYRREHGLNDERLKLDSEQLELTARTNVSFVMETISLASARTPAIPVVDATTDDSAMPTKLLSPCPPIAALPSLLIAALPAARPTTAQEGKRPAPTNESTELLMTPKRHRGSGQITNDGAATGSSLTNCGSLSEKVAIERLIAALDIPALVAPATGATTFGNAPAAGALAADVSALIAPAAGVPIFGNAPAIGVSAPNISALVAPTVEVPAVDMRASDSITAAELLRMIYDVSDMVFDGSGEQVTSERLLVVLGEAPYVSLRYAQEAYRHIYGCALMPRTTSSQHRIATLASVVALEHWLPQLVEEDPAHISDLSIICRLDLERTKLRQNYLGQLGLANDPDAAVLGPCLCYVIVKMCSMSVDILTGPILRSMFLGATGLDLHSLNVVTEKGVQRMGAESISHMVVSWVGNIIKFIADDGNGLEGALSMATDCNALYVTRCSNGSSSNTSVAVDMLMNNELYSSLFLGNNEAKWEALFSCLTFVTGKNTSSYAKECLVQLSKRLQVQPGS
ncbi:hypothetical protein H4S04_001440 [Coemansia sp. S16]|nr:hypothetical protein H4S04_001440 [Coemansia sp. S16]KAJ2071585.1 hypothetical protein GGH13_003258 [Coemansia sp. S155-1]KAJ2351997.1 hypothetical protein GGH92_001516 [Coemansia sp. RSA 2673]